MKSLRLFCLVTMTLVTTVAGSPDWQDPQVTSRGRELPHASFFAYPDATTALANAPLLPPLAERRHNSPFCASLNGSWQFHWASNAPVRPVSFQATDFDDSRWPTIPVPACWQLYGWGAQPLSRETIPPGLYEWDISLAPITNSGLDLGELARTTRAQALP